MKKLKKISLNEFSQVEIEKRNKKFIMGGYGGCSCICGCSCNSPSCFCDDVYMIASASAKNENAIDSSISLTETPTSSGVRWYV
ncbi:MAG: TIGR04149 family rSAM-modified RiPP [Tannerella sp.]|jgi:natural product precursor|nr:TIGR04149 family rSAM-modified RiPP [Tannerella sp.]